MKTQRLPPTFLPCDCGAPLGVAYVEIPGERVLRGREETTTP
jgi:hypothetical protein